jgi:hypothetical protein
MAQTVPFGISAPSAERARTAAQATTIPWFVWSGIISVSSICFGLYWDISWHMTIGRDTFWTPAHLLIQFGGILAAITCTYLIFSTTFSHDPAVQSSSVKVWRFRGPVGAFLTAWGGVTMVTSAPFDNWWHNSFGLDVEILSPPHVVLGWGILGVGIGYLILVVSAKNRAAGAVRAKLTWLFLYLAGLGLMLHMILISEFSDARFMHSAVFYRVLMLVTPLLIMGYATASEHKWGATIVASVYMAVELAGLWILPLFAAQPKLGPVYTNVTHMVPMGFPVLLVFPAFAFDLVRARLAGRNKWLLALVAGTAYLLTLLVVHWPFGSFMISPLARNWFFGMIYFPYQEPVSMHQLNYQFENYEPTRAAFFRGLGLAWIFAFISTRIGIAFGGWLLKVRR